MVVESTSVFGGGRLCSPVILRFFVPGVVI